MKKLCHLKSFLLYSQHIIALPKNIVNVNRKQPFEFDLLIDDENKLVLAGPTIEPATTDESTSNVSNNGVSQID